jgi:peptide/nickel transport system substrate-binding protein
MTRALLAPAAVAALAALAATGCGKALPSNTTATGGGSGAAAPTATTQLPTTTPAGSNTVDKVTWATYRDVGTLDPIQAFDYPENTVDTALCDSLLKQNPDGSLAAGISSLPEHPDDTTTIFRLNPDARFSDGKPVTAADVVFNLKRAQDPKAGGFYPAVFTRVKSITATDDHTVTIKLSKPDYWLDGELSQMAGIVYEKAYAEAKGKKLGTPSGGIVCAGPYVVKNWEAGAALTLKANPNYWSTPKPKVQEITFKGVPDESSLTTGLITGGIQGSYPQALSSLDQLKSNPKVTVTEGASYSLDAIVISSLKGALGDVRVRQALSAAIDRNAYIQSVYKGGAQVPHNLANPGAWGYGKDTFQADWQKLPAMTQDLNKAKDLIKQAGASGKTITLGMTNEVSNLASSANAIRSAGEAIGLKVKFKAVSAQNFINFFTDPKAREGIDGFPTVNYPDYADPAALYNTIVAPDGSQNYSAFKDDAINALMDQARTTQDPDARAKLVAQAGDEIAEQLPWIPMAAPNNVLVTSSRLSGAPASFVYMGGPWANLMGGK